VLVNQSIPVSLNNQLLNSFNIKKKSVSENKTKKNCNLKMTLIHAAVCILIFSLAQNDPDSWVVIETTTKPVSGR